MALVRREVAAYDANFNNTHCRVMLDVDPHDRPPNNNIQVPGLAPVETLAEDEFGAGIAEDVRLGKILRHGAQARHAGRAPQRAHSVRRRRQRRAPRAPAAIPAANTRKPTQARCGRSSIAELEPSCARHKPPLAPRRPAPGRARAP